MNIAGCAGCHVLKAAGAEGNVGPSLDSLNVTLHSAVVQDMVSEGTWCYACIMVIAGMLTNEEQVDIRSAYLCCINSIAKENNYINITAK